MGFLRRFACDRGDVLADGLIHLAASLAVVALLCFELVAVGVNMVQLDELAGGWARSAARNLPKARHPVIRQAAAELHVREAAASHPDVVVQQVTVDGDEVGVTLHKQPRTLLLRHLPPIADRLPEVTTARARPPSW